MNKIAISLKDPLETLIRRALALPEQNVADRDLTDTMRLVHQLGHGRSVETSIGRIPIAPPVMPGLATMTIYAATRSELLSQVKRLIASTSATSDQAEQPASPPAWFQRSVPPPSKPNGRRRPKPPPLAVLQPETKRAMKNVTVHITPHNVKLSRRLREFVRRKITGLSRFSADLLSAEVVVRGPSGTAPLFSVSSRLALPGRDVQANAAHPNLYGAINKVAARLARLSRKRKTRLTRTVRQRGKKRAKRLPDASSLLYVL
jgi:ribosomal subunit interface protein